jgi:S1-C subfamily serine protease
MPPSLTIKASKAASLHNPATGELLYLVGCLVTLLLTPVAVGAQMSNNAEVIETAKRTIAPVVCLVRDAATGNGIVPFRTAGTAFMVGSSGTFVTAKHVIDELLATPWKQACRTAISFPVGGWKRENQEMRWFDFAAPICQVNSNFDVAICRTTQDMAKQGGVSYAVADISTERPPDGTPVIFCGFPLQATDPITSLGTVSGFSSGDNYNTVVIDKPAWPGASGSPILKLDGKIIGMLTSTGSGAAAGLSYGVVGARITSILADARAYWERATEEQKPK